MRGGPALLALALAGAGAAEVRAGRDPAIEYMLECQGCHAADGSGSPGAVPSLVDSVARFALVPGGREYLIRVPGSAQSRLSDADLAAVLNWMLRRFGPADAAARCEDFSADEVARHRAHPLVDVESVRRELLARIEAGAAAEAPR